MIELISKNLQQKCFFDVQFRYSVDRIVTIHEDIPNLLKTKNGTKKNLQLFNKGIILIE